MLHYERRPNQNRLTGSAYILCVWAEAAQLLLVSSRGITDEALKHGATCFSRMRDIAPLPFMQDYARCQFRQRCSYG